MGLLTIGIKNAALPGQTVFDVVRRGTKLEVTFLKYAYKKLQQINSFAPTCLLRLRAAADVGRSRNSRAITISRENTPQSSFDFLRLVTLLRLLRPMGRGL